MKIKDLGILPEKKIPSSGFWIGLHFKEYETASEGTRAAYDKNCVVNELLDQIGNIDVELDEDKVKQILTSDNQEHGNWGWKEILTALCQSNIFKVTNKP